MKQNGFCENEQLRSFVPGIGKRGDRLIAALFELAELPQCRRMSWRRRDPGRRETRAAARGFPLLLWTKNDFARRPQESG